MKNLETLSKRISNWGLGGSKEEWDHYAGLISGNQRNKVPPEINFESLRDITKIFDKHGIDYCVAWGTLLGVVRDGKLIEGDTDVDLWVDVKNFDRLKKMALEEGFMRIVIDYACGEDWILSIFKVRKGVGCYIDISFYEDEGGDYVAEYICGPANQTKEQKINNKTCLHLPKKIFFPTEYFKIKGHKIKMPHDPIAALEWSYGNSWGQKLQIWQDYKWEAFNNAPKITITK